MSDDDDVVLPVAVVELSSLKTKSGKPVRVRCERIDELAVAAVLKSWPGRGPGETSDATLTDPEEMLREVNRFAAPLIEQSTVLLKSDGSEVRPAFYYTSTPPVEGSIAGRMLLQADVVMLVSTIMQLCGYGGAAQTTFHDGVGAGGADGLGADEACEADRQNTVGDRA